MIVNFTYYIILFAIASIAVGFLWIRNNRNPLENWKAGLWLIVIAGSLFAWLGSAITKNYTIIDSDMSRQHLECIGSPTITLKDGTEIETRGLGTGINGKWIFNASERDLIGYPVVYGDGGIFGRDISKTPEPYLVESGYYLKVKRAPDYYFVEPPKSISVDEHWLIHIFSSIFGSKEVKWVLDVYEGEE